MDDIEKVLNTDIEKVLNDTEFTNSWDYDAALELAGLAIEARKERDMWKKSVEGRANETRMHKEFADKWKNQYDAAIALLVAIADNRGTQHAIELMFVDFLMERGYNPLRSDMDHTRFAIELITKLEDELC